mmetsp:Transcript_10813/g.34373  ORF Transcript_10813/g.34373 Transcript_10813/m.34373 type:complete len:262 (-) Transcript_10813:33-818(-)
MPSSAIAHPTFGGTNLRTASGSCAAAALRAAVRPRWSGARQSESGSCGRTAAHPAEPAAPHARARPAVRPELRWRDALAVSWHEAAPAAPSRHMRALAVRPAAAVPTMIAARQSGATRRSESPSGTAATAGKRKAGTSSTGSAARSHAAEGPSRRCSLTPADGTAQTQPSDRRAAMAGGKWRSRAERTAAAPRSAARKKATPPSTCAFDGAGSEGASWQSDRAGDRLAGRDSWTRRCKQAAGRRRARRVAQCMHTPLSPTR